MYNGIINIYKEAGFTSHDVVAKLRGILKQKKIGHTGTLDPEAVGVLPVCLGKGTKVCDLLTDKDKLSIAMQLERIEEGVRKWRNAARSLKRQEQQTVGPNGQEVAVRHE